MPNAVPLRRRRVLAVVLSIGAVVSTAVSVQAGDEGGLGFFQSLFGSPQAAPAPEPVPSPAPAAAAPQAQSPYRVFGRRHARRADGVPVRAKVRYAALPKSDPVAPRALQKGRAAGLEPASDRQRPLDMTAGPTAALLKDPTLRPGDIVVLPGGAHVFKGTAGKRHALRDFEEVSRSALVDRKTRARLAAMVAPAGALPANEARRAMARLKRAAPTGPDPAEIRPETTAMRVIYP